MVELISRDEHEKLYLQLYDIFKKKIENQEWPVGTQIPTEEQLCKIFKVSRATVRNALIELVRQGYLIRQQGKGTFVSKSSISEGLMMMTHLNQLWVDDESIFKKNILAKTILMPVGDLNKDVGIPENKHVIYIKILWFTGQESTMIQEVFVPLDICPQLIEENLETSSIFELLEKKYSVKITKVLNYIELVTLNKELSSSFGIPENTAALLLTQKIYSGEVIIMLNKVYKKPDAYKLFIAFHRKAL